MATDINTNQMNRKQKRNIIYLFRRYNLLSWQRIKNSANLIMIKESKGTINWSNNTKDNTSNTISKAQLGLRGHAKPQSTLTLIQSFLTAPPQWLVEPSDTQVVLHQSVRIDCLASGSPKPFTTWKRATGKCFIFLLFCYIFLNMKITLTVRLCL